MRAETAVRCSQSSMTGGIKSGLNDLFLLGTKARTNNTAAYVLKLIGRIDWSVLCVNLSLSFWT
jgi:hypothetical protein